VDGRDGLQNLGLNSTFLRWSTAAAALELSTGVAMKTVCFVNGSQTELRSLGLRALKERDTLFRMRLVTIILAVAALVVAAEKSAEGVKSAEKSWATATVAGDEALLRQVLADDLTYTHSTGETDNKTQFISNLKTGVRKYVKVNHESMDVRVYGNTAVLMATALIETTQNGGAPNPAHLKWVHVWVNENGRWRLVAHQSLRLSK